MGHALNKKSQEDCFPAVLRQSKAALNSTNMKSTVGCPVLKHVLNTLHATVSTGTPHTSGIYKSRVNNEWQFKDEGLGAMFYVQKEADGENIKSRENVDNKAKENKKVFERKLQKLMLNFQMRIQSGGDMWESIRFGCLTRAWCYIWQLAGDYARHSPWIHADLVKASKSKNHFPGISLRLITVKFLNHKAPSKL